MKQKELVAQYFFHQITAMEGEVDEIQRRVRFRRIAVNDAYELQYALARLELMKQVCKDVSVFLRIEDNVIK